MSEHYRSQHGEDEWIDRHWSELGLPDVGYFVEFGAADGERFSNTYWLEHAKGWSGLLIDADPRHVITCRPKSVFERCAIGPRASVEFGQCEEPQLSGTLRRPKDYKTEVRAINMIQVEQYPLSVLLDRHRVDSVDVISIDTEGTELDAWRTLDLSRWRPRVAIIELITWGLRNSSGKIIRRMEIDGYRLAERTYHNGIFTCV
jgi:FkbM family methyltransferase